MLKSRGESFSFALRLKAHNAVEDPWKLSSSDRVIIDMRVLLPLRKVASDAQASNSDLLELEEAAGQGIDLTVEVSNENVLPEPFKQPAFRKGQITVPALGACEQHRLEQQTQLKAIIREAKRQPIDLPKESRLIQAAEGPIVTGNKKPVVSSLHHRSFHKRKLLHPEVDTKVSRKRPALDRKPAAKDTMGAPGRSSNWSYHRKNVDEDREVSPDRSVSNGLSVNRHSPQSDDDSPSTPEADVDFETALKKQGLEIREQAGDGNCLFRAVSLQVYGDPSMHMDVRKQCMDHMVSLDACAVDR